ncbi:MAG: ATP-binding protein [Chromatiaceae bacterium]|jgi:signal transduction histidine kinase/HAMP domain-containing protein
MVGSFRTLKVQILLAITLLTGLFAASAFNSMVAIDQQRADAMLLRVAARLSYEQQDLTMQSMKYHENTPQDQTSYDRDLQFYFEDLKRSLVELDEIIDAFSSNRFNHLPETADLAEMCRMPAAAQQAAIKLAEHWEVFSSDLDEMIGDDPAMPLLEKAARTILTHNAELERYSGELVDILHRELGERADRARLINRLLLGLAFLVALGIGAWFYLRVLRPMSQAVRGFHVVANGDFSHRVPIVADNEIGWLVGAFNQLAGRMDTLRRLLTGLEQNGDLDSTLKTLSQTLPNLMPVDWIGVLVVGVDGRIHLERAFSDAEPDPIGQQSFDTDRTLLEECLKTSQPLHIADVQQMSQLSARYVFLRRLYDLGRRDAIFQPVGGGGGLRGVVVFATRYPNSYRTEHIELLRNLGPLISVSLARTLRLIESQRLANIGQFTSGIVHEIRNPLSTISLALEHLAQLQELPPNSGRRVALATEEIGRLDRLLDDILIYAKPLVIDRQPTVLADLIKEVSAGIDDDRLQLELQEIPDVAVDRDRIKQVLINLIRNALDASPPGESVTVEAGPADEPGWVAVRISNGGAGIAETDRQRLFEPFFTTKQNGTGLGLPIVQRLVQAHSGRLTVESDRERGTVATVRLPRIGNPSTAGPRGAPGNPPA